MAAAKQLPQVFQDSEEQLRKEFERLMGEVAAFYPLWADAAYLRWRCHELGLPLDHDPTGIVLPETADPYLQFLWLKYLYSSNKVMQLMSDESEIYRDRFLPFTDQDAEGQPRSSKLFLYFYTRCVLLFLRLEPPDNLPFLTRNIIYGHPYYRPDHGLWGGMDQYTTKDQYGQWQAYNRFWHPGPPGRPKKEVGTESPTHTPKKTQTAHDAPHSSRLIDPALAIKAALYAATLPNDHHKLRKVADYLWPEWRPKTTKEGKARWAKAKSHIQRGNLYLAEEKVDEEN